MQKISRVPDEPQCKGNKLQSFGLGETLMGETLIQSRKGIEVLLEAIGIGKFLFYSRKGIEAILWFESQP